MSETRVRLAGFGGQGIGRAAYVLGKAVSIHDRREAVLTREYGPESRGGASAASVVVADAPIAEPFVEHPDVFIAMTQAAFAKYAADVDPGALVIVDEDLVEGGALPPRARLLRVPATRIAERLGRKVVANVVMLGFLAAVAEGLVSQRGLREAVRSSVPAATVELNLEAFEAGHAHGLRTLEGAGGDG